MAPNRSSLEAILRGCGINLGPDQVDALWAYHRMLREANADLNLTRIHNFENMVLKHYVDSLLVLKHASLPSPLVDMGSGPGLPGIPLKIARPGVQMILAEPRGARATFLETVRDRLKLDGVEVYAGKVGPKFPHRVRGVITRAVASIPETLDRVAECLEPGGRMLLMKGPDCDDEIKEARRTHGEAFRLVSDHAYRIPGTEHERRLVVYERLDAPAPTSFVAPEKAHDGPTRELASVANPTFKMMQDLLSARGIRKHGRALVSGARVVAEVVQRFPGRIEGWLTVADGPPPPPIVTPDRPIWFRLSEPLFKELDAAGTRSPLLLVKVPKMADWADAAPWPDGCTLFVPFQDPENVGAVIRSAAAFGAARVVLLREAAHPFHPKAARAAGTALFQVPLEQGPSIHDLAAASAPIFSLATDGPEVGAAPFPDRFGLVVGVEGPGLPEHLRSGPTLCVPMEPGVESLNAATAAAISLYAWRQARTKGVE
ncbi:16S rRNA (guanine(527)-N(7))-methyltransferase RsmG [Tundrisphaera sp. TA3]|uniref:16S rRNA (guanine(527)-N(7))-methyltransferase RsmG n=1 Tax=Tundrisphaera sp. TA3 TaxID=3435775 RepID=UPI003EBA507C